MSFYYQMSPNQILLTKPVCDEKKNKIWIIVLFNANVIGIDKLKLWVIGNAKCPRPLSKINIEWFLVYYHRNSEAWMNSMIFEEVLCELDSYFRAKNKKILLLIDNALSHFDPHYLPTK